MIPKYIPAVPDLVDEREGNIQLLKRALWLTALFGAGLLPPPRRFPVKEFVSEAAFVGGLASGVDARIHRRQSFHDTLPASVVCERECSAGTSGDAGEKVGDIAVEVRLPDTLVVKHALVELRRRRGDRGLLAARLVRKAERRNRSHAVREHSGHRPREQCADVVPDDDAVSAPRAFMRPTRSPARSK